MATTVRIINIIKEPAPSSRIRVRFADGVELEYAGAQQLKETCREMDSNIDFTRQLAVAMWAAKDPDLSNTILARKQVTFDLSAVDPIKAIN